METVRCNLCGKAEGVEVYRDDVIRAVICDNCTLVYLNPRAGEAEYEAYYRTGYQIKRHQIYEYDQAISRLREKRSYEKKQKYLFDLDGYINKGSKVLEVGSGWGTLLRVIKDRYHCEVEGVEPSELATQVSQKHYGIKTNNETLTQYLEKAGGGKFDVIIMHHVLEHFLDPGKILHRLAQLLNPGGVFYIAVPNVKTPDEPLDRFFRMEHCFYFSPLTLSLFLKKEGLKIIRLISRPNEMRILAAQETMRQVVIPEKNYTKEKIIRALRRQERKYRILRAGKKFVRRVLPLSFFIVVRRITLRILKRARIVEL